MSNPAGADLFQAQSSAFLTWLTSRGASISPNIQLADLRDQDAGRGVVAISPLPTNTELFRIPRSAILTPSTSSIPTSILADLSDPWLTLILAMIHEHQLDSASAWKPYLDLIPSHFDTIMFWTDSELKHLSGSAVVDKIGKASADETFTRELLPRIRLHAAEFRSENHSDEQLLGLCHRMGSAIMAYAFDLEDPESNPERQGREGGGEAENEDGWEEASDDDDGEATTGGGGSRTKAAASFPKGMIPLADLLNADADRNNAKLFFHEDPSSSSSVVMKTIRPVERGEELLNDYGPLPRADVLRRYGYVTGNYAKYDVVEISLGLIREQARELFELSEEEVQRRAGYLDEQGILDDSYDVARAGNEEEEDGQFSEEMGGLLNALTMPQNEFDRLRGKGKLPKPEMSDAARELMRVVAMKRLAMYPEAGGSMVDGDERRIRMARAVVEGEKVVLREAIDAVTRNESNNKKRQAETLDENSERKKKR